MNIITFLGGSVIGGFFGYFIKHFLDLRYSKKLEEMNSKRQVYESVIDSLNVFISGRNNSENTKDKFLQSYARMWLWASDDVIKSVGLHLDQQVRIARNSKDVSKDELKASFAAPVIEMRKDLGYPQTTLKKQDYKFVSFN